MKLFVTGATGMLGTSLCRLASRKGHQVVGMSRGNQPRPLFENEQHLKGDLRSKGELLQMLRMEKPEAIIHTAAVTDVDLCERDPVLAEAVNAAGTASIAQGAREIGALLCYVSTDYVFDGTASTPYREEDPTRPLNVYGRTKLEGERGVRDHLSYYITRTSWLFGEGHDSFVHHVLAWAQTKPELRLVDDKWCTPSYTPDVAAGILALLEKRSPYGIYHLTNGGEGCSWRRYGQEILRLAGLGDLKVLPMTLKELSLAAARPAMTVLNTEKFQGRVMAMRNWQKALKEYLVTVVSLPRSRS